LPYRVDEEGVVVYSVGVDGKDDGGVETPEKLEGGDDLHRRGNPDVVFRARAVDVEQYGEKRATGSDP
jgi:hypothetical protein